MWYDGDAAIFSNGKRYYTDFDSKQAGDSFRGLKGVKITTESPEDYMPMREECGQEVSAPTGQKDHILSICIDGSLYWVLNEGEYIKKLSALTPEGRAAILERTSFLEDLEDTFMEREYLENLDLDPLDFDSYEEYQTLMDIVDDRAWQLAELKADLETKEILYSGFRHPVVACIRTEFYEIFSKYGLWFDFETAWWLTSHYCDRNAPLFQSSPFAWP